MTRQIYGYNVWNYLLTLKFSKVIDYSKVREAVISERIYTCHEVSISLMYSHTSQTSSNYSFKGGNGVRESRETVHISHIK